MFFLFLFLLRFFFSSASVLVLDFGPRFSSSGFVLLFRNRFSSSVFSSSVFSVLGFRSSGCGPRVLSSRVMHLSIFIEAERSVASLYRELEKTETYLRGGWEVPKMISIS